MKLGRPFALLVFGLLVGLFLFLALPGRPPSEEGVRVDDSMVPSASADRDEAQSPSSENATTLIDGPSSPGNSAQPSNPAENNPDAMLLADRNARELLFENGIVLGTIEERIGGSDRFVRRTLYETSFKYKYVLKKEVIEVEEGGIETVISEELMVGDHVLVSLPDGVEQDVLEDWADQNGFGIRHRLRTAPIVLLAAENPEVGTVEQLQNSVSEFFQGIGKDPDVEISEPDFIYFPTVTPNDPFYSDLWGLHNVGQTGGSTDSDIDGPESWDITPDASSVLVAVIDTGVDRAHPDLSGNMWTNPFEIPGNGVDDDNNGFIDDVHGWDFFDDDNDPNDGGSHGTHCAGTIGAVGNNGVGVVGVCWDVSMVGIRFLGPTGGTTSGAIESVNYATSLGVDLTSNSWGGGGYSSLLLQAIENGGSDGILFVAAAGNESVDNDVNPHYPSSYPSEDIISVAASDDEDRIASFSNWGRNSVDLAAPGVFTYSTVPNSGYGYKSGTSMATPHVTGAIALLRSVAPQLSHLDLKEQLLESVDPVPDFSQTTTTGGRMNLYSAMLAVGGPSLQLTGFSARDDSTGDGNGIINPGETVSVQFDMTNQGSQTAQNVTARLIRGPGSVFSGGNNTVQLGSIASGQSLSRPSAFQITASAQAATPLEEALAIRFEWGSSGQFSRDFPITLAVSTSSLISGRVTQATGGGGIGGAVVTYNGPVSGVVTTNAGGLYEIPVIDGSYTIRATAAGFASSQVQSVTTPPDRTGIDFVLGKPDLEISPSTFYFDLFSGQSVSESMTLTNTGDIEMNWSLSTSQGVPTVSALRELPAVVLEAGDPDLPANSGEVEISSIFTPASDLAGVRIGLIVTWVYSVFEDDLTQRGAIVDNSVTFPLTPNQLDDYDILLVDDEISSANAQDIQQLRSWVNDGGGLLMMGDNSESIPNMNSVLADSGIQEVYRGSFDTFTITDIETHPVTTGVSSVYSSQSGTLLTVTGEATVLMREPDGAAHAAAGALGAGRIVAVGNEIASSSNFTSGDTRLFANQIVGWLNDKFGWLSVTPENGVLAPGASIVVQVSVDTAGLVAGFYVQSVLIDSNDPVSPTIVVPVGLEVTGAPSLTIVESQLVFGDTIVGQTSTETVTLQNPGTDELVISSLSTSSPQFSVVDAAPIMLPPGGEHQLTVRFSPMIAGVDDASLTIISNDPSNSNYQLPLSGAGFSAPQIGGRVTTLTGGSAVGSATITYSGPSSGMVTADSNGDYLFSGEAGSYTVTASAVGFSPETLSVTIPPDQLDLNFALGAPLFSVDPDTVSVSLFSGDIEDRIVTFSNDGDVDLTWSATLGQFSGQELTRLPALIAMSQDPDATMARNSERSIPALETTLDVLNGVRIGVISTANYSTILSDLAQRGAVIDSTLSFPITLPELQQLDILIIDDSIVFATTSNLNSVREWIEDGGGLLLMGDNAGSIAFNNTILNGSGIQTVSRGGFGAYTMTDIREHPTTEGVSVVYGSGVGAYCTVTGDAEYLVRTVDGRIHAAAGSLGSGRIIAVGDELLLNTNFVGSQTRQFSNQVIDWLAFESDAGWLTIDSSSGTIVPGGQAEILLQFDSSGLSAGTYEVDWLVDSNDANSPRITIPVSLDVDGHPNLEVEPATSLSFPDTYTGQLTSLPVSISNTGTEILMVTSIDSSMPQFSVPSSLPLSIAPGGAMELNVHFAPDAGGVFNGSLTIVSDDSSDGTVILGLTGNGVVAPAFSVNPDSLEITVSEGQSHSGTIEIENIGGAELTWTASVSPTDPVSAIYDVDWDTSPHVVGQRTATGGPYAPTNVSFGNPTVRQSLAGMTNRPLDLVGGSGGTFNYSQIRFNMGGMTEKVILEFDLQKLDADPLAILFDAPTVFRIDFNASSISFGSSIPYNSSALNRVRIEFDLGANLATLSLNGAAPVTRSLSSSLTALSSIRFSASDQGTAGGTLIDNVLIATQAQGASTLQILPEADWLSMTPLSGVLTPGQKQTAAVEIDSATLPAGDHLSEIEFQTNDPVNPVVTVPVEVSVVPLPEIEIEWLDTGTILSGGASDVVFDTVIGGGSDSQWLRIRNRGAGVLTGLSVSLVGAQPGEFSVANSPSSVNPGGLVNIPVYYNPSQQGQHEATLRIESNDLDESPFDITLTGQLVPDIPEIEIRTPDGTILTSGVSEVLVPRVSGNNSSELVMTIRNRGTGYLRNLSALIEGAEAPLFATGNFGSQTVNPNEETTFTVTFTPEFPGQRSALLRVNSNDSDENPFEITLMADAIPSQTTFLSWAESYGLAGAALAPTSDDDGDSVALIHEYAFNLDPTRRDVQVELVPGTGSSGLPSIRLVGDRWRVEYLRRLSDPNLDLQVLFGSSLSPGSPGGLAPPAGPETLIPIDVDWVRVIVSDSETTLSSSRRFVQWSVESVVP